MRNINNGVLDGVRRIGADVRSLSITGTASRGAAWHAADGGDVSGAPQTGTWKAGSGADRCGNAWVCTTGGTGRGRGVGAGLRRRVATQVLASAAAPTTFSASPAGDSLLRAVVIGSHQARRPVIDPPEIQVNVMRYRLDMQGVLEAGIGGRLVSAGRAVTVVSAAPAAMRDLPAATRDGGHRRQLEASMILACAGRLAEDRVWRPGYSDGPRVSVQGRINETWAQPIACRSTSASPHHAVRAGARYRHQALLDLS